MENRINLIDAEDYLFYLIKDWEEFKRRNAGRMVSERIQFKEFIRRISNQKDENIDLNEPIKTPLWE